MHHNINVLIVHNITYQSTRISEIWLAAHNTEIHMIRAQNKMSRNKDAGDTNITKHSSVGNTCSCNHATQRYKQDKVLPSLVQVLVRPQRSEWSLIRVRPFHRAVHSARHQLLTSLRWVMAARLDCQGQDWWPSEIPAPGIFYIVQYSTDHYCRNRLTRNGVKDSG